MQLLSSHKYYVVQWLSCVWLFVTPWTAAMPGFPVLYHLPELAQTHVHLFSGATSSSVIPFPSCVQSFQASGSFPVSQFFTSDAQSIGASASSPILPMNIQSWFPLGLMVWSPCCLSNSKESSPAPQLESINSSVLSFLYGPTLTSICDPYMTVHTLCH